MKRTILISVLMMMTGCGTFGGDDPSVTIVAEMTAYTTESAMIQQMAQSEQTQIIETLEAVGTSVADASSVNIVLAATVQANVIPTPALREVIVDAGDMGSSLDAEMMDAEGGLDGEITQDGEMQINNPSTARSVRSSDGCSNGTVTQFTDDDERIYFTAQISNLQSGTNFSVDWVFEERLVYRSVWTADYSASSECIWFYMTQDDAPFLPGVYTVTLYVNGNALPSQQFSISIG